MNKQEAISLLGGKPSTAAKLIGVTVAAICNWPDELPPRIVDRVQAALWRQANQKKRVKKHAVTVDAPAEIARVTP